MHDDAPEMLNQQLRPATSNRLPRAMSVRIQTAGQDGFMPAPIQIDNGDEARYSDKSATYTKGIQQTGVGLVDLAAYRSFKKALSSGDPVDFQNIVTGGPRTQNGPQGGLAFYLKCADASQFVVPPAPAVASEAYATELVELYWASLLRDTPFSNYAGDPTAASAAAELSAMPAYAGPRNSAGKVTPDLLFRGTFAGEQVGPYISQLLLQTTSLGALPVIQRYNTTTPVDFMLAEAEFQAVQNGQPAGKNLTPGAVPLYMHDGRGLAAYTHSDVLYQAYFIAYLVLSTFQSANPKLINPGNPYAPGTPAAKTQNGFSTMGGPDIAATLAAVAAEAIKAVWYQKWWVHLRHRPESGGAILYLQKTGKGGSIETELHNAVLNSHAVEACFAKNKSYLLSQAFPEGSPTHPAYPTGHGAVAGACITVLKFFFDGAAEIPNPMVPNASATDLVKYVPPAGEKLTVNGELHKLASNISFGHGTHAGIHWRSDTLTSIQLGEAVALSYLRDQARTYNEKFSITLTKLDGTTATITNH